MRDFIQLGLNTKHKIKTYISSTHKKQAQWKTNPLFDLVPFHVKITVAPAVDLAVHSQCKSVAVGTLRR